MAYVSLSHFLPNDRHRRRKKLRYRTFEDPSASVPCMSTFRNEPLPSLGWILKKSEDAVSVARQQQEPIPQDMRAPVCKECTTSSERLLPSNLRNYENTLGLPRFFEPENFKDVPVAVCYTYVNLDVLLKLTQRDSKVGFSVVTTTEGCEVNHVTQGLTLCSFGRA
ncbi:hypothetical protein Aduo_015874 [Ancylostoma duodenale]